MNKICYSIDCNENILMSVTMKWWNNFTLAEKAVVLIDIILMISLLILTKNNVFPQPVGVLLIFLVAISILLALALLINRK